MQNTMNEIINYLFLNRTVEIPWSPAILFFGVWIIPLALSTAYYAGKLRICREYLREFKRSNRS